MGAETLEDSEFEPVFNECEPKLNGKKISLFGSYGWGDGEWMRTWRKPVIRQAQFSQQKVLSAMMLPMTKPRQTVMHSVQHLQADKLTNPLYISYFS